MNSIDQSTSLHGAHADKCRSIYMCLVISLDVFIYGIHWTVEVILSFQKIKVWQLTSMQISERRKIKSAEHAVHLYSKDNREFQFIAM